jgi:hypothetical protein
LFNPGFGKEKIISTFEKNNINHPYNLVVLGENDTIVFPESVIRFFKKHNEKNFDLYKIPGLGHRIDLNNFEKTTTAFYKKINT